jgi:hypothetical protein
MRSEDWHRNVAELEVSGASLCFVDDDVGLSLRASLKEGGLPAQVEWRMTEAITFVLGVIPNWSRIIRSEGTEQETRFRSVEMETRKRPQWPPFRIDVVEPCVWQLFQRFYEFVSRNQESQTHPLARQINGVALSHESTIEGQALAVAVAVESVLGELYAQASGSADAQLISGLDELLRYVHEWKGDLQTEADKRIIARAAGAIGQIKRLRPDDRLRELVATGAIGETERKAWKELRNVVAHGNWAKYELQGLLDLTHRVFVLFNQLIFHQIGYVGMYSDYGEHGWPTAQYPREAPAAAAAT